MLMDRSHMGCICVVCERELRLAYHRRLGPKDCRSSKLPLSHQKKQSGISFYADKKGRACSCLLR